jgi:hypothetical protein
MHHMGTAVLLLPLYVVVPGLTAVMREQPFCAARVGVCEWFSLPCASSQATPNHNLRVTPDSIQAPSTACAAARTTDNHGV